MLKNYLKLALRNAGRHRWYTFINVLGLAVGMACYTLILLWVQHELSFDRFHRRGDFIYQILVEDPQPVATMFRYGTPRGLARYLEGNFPEIEDCANFLNWMSMVRAGGKTFNESGCALVDPHLFDIFSFPVVYGDPDKLLPGNHSVVVTREIAQKYFGTARALGETVTIDGTVPLVVSGVIDLPDNTTIRADIFLPFDALDLSREPYLNAKDNWRSLRVSTFALLAKHAKPGDVESKISCILQKFNPDKKWLLRIKKFEDVYLYSLGDDYSRIRNIFLFLSIGSFILLIGCINFINLATARSEKRAREVGLRKAVGAFRKQIVRQFFAESTVQTLMAFIVALVMVECFLPSFNALSGKNLALRLLDFHHIVILAGVIFFTAIGSGSYTALFLSSRSLLGVLRGSPWTGRSKTRLRKILVIFQFFMATLLIIGTLTVYAQLKFMKEKELGLDRDNLFYIYLTGKCVDNVGILKQELGKHPGIVSSAACDRLPSMVSGFTSDVLWEGKARETWFYFAFTGADFEYLDTLGLHLVRGRKLSEKFPGDKNNLIINEEAARRIGIDPVVGAQLTLWGKEGQVVGVVEDFNFQPLQKKISPLIITARDGRLKGFLLVRVAPGKIAGSLEYLKKVWGRVNPGYPLEYRSLMREYDHMYDNEEKLATLLLYFSGMAVFLSGLGLLGLTSFTAEQRTKEFGVRKILGAGTGEIFLQLMRQFFLWVLLGVCMAWPVGFWFAKQWLSNFAYHIEPETGNFFISSGVALAIAFLAMAFQAVKTSRAHPVDSLRYE